MIEILLHIFRLLSGIFVVIISLITIFSKLNTRSLENIKKRYEYYKEIITDMNNKVLAYTGLKEYLGFSISDKFAEYILTSTKFYEIITIVKIMRIEFDLTTNKNIYIKNAKCERRLFIIPYLIFLAPFILFLSFFDLDLIVQNSKHLITSIILVIPWTILAIYFALEASKRTLVIKLLKKMNEE